MSSSCMGLALIEQHWTLEFAEQHHKQRTVEGTKELQDQYLLLHYYDLIIVFL